MKKLLTILSFIGILLAAACSDPYEDTTFQVYDLNPASTYMDSRPEDFSEFVEVLHYADLYNAINQASGSFTVFAPNNKAMQEFYQKKGVSSMEDLGLEYARDFAKSHILGDSLAYADFIKGGELDVPTLSNDKITVTFGETETGETGLNAVYLNNEAHVIEMSTRVSNGFIYVLENAMTPVVESIYQRLKEGTNDSYQILQEALDKTGWADSLNTIRDTVWYPTGAYSVSERVYTLLAVSDDTFSKFGVTSVDNLVSKLGAGSDYESKENELNRYVAYHIIKGRYSVAKMEMERTDTVGTYSIQGTLAEGAVIKISKEADEKTYLNYGDADNRASFVAQSSDIKAKNGIMHQVNTYLPIWEPEASIIQFDFCDYPEVASYIATNATEGQKYQTSDPSNEYRTKITNLEPPYEVEITSPASYDSYNALDYFTVKESSDWKKCLNKDQLIINVGYMGSVSMDTPTIIKGRYKVTLKFCFATSMDFMRTATGGSNGGKMKFTFDGQHAVECTPYTTVPEKKLGNYEYVLYEDITFDQTQDHRMKIVVMDPAAGTNDKFRIQLDYLLFEPLD